MSGVLWSVVEDKLDLMEAYWVYLHSSNQGVRANSLASAVFRTLDGGGGRIMFPSDQNISVYPQGNLVVVEHRIGYI